MRMLAGSGWRRYCEMGAGTKQENERLPGHTRFAGISQGRRLIHRLVFLPFAKRLHTAPR